MLLIIDYLRINLEYIKLFSDCLYMMNHRTVVIFLYIYSFFKTSSDFMFLVLYTGDDILMCKYVFDQLFNIFGELNTENNNNL